MILLSFSGIVLLIFVGTWIQDWREKRYDQFRHIEKHVVEFTGHKHVRKFLND